MLFVVATPIGHLADISQRALSTLASVDAILCEDTRRSAILLQRYEIKKPLLSYHKFNEKKGEEKILAELAEGRKLALISDAGTPCINDPGQRLVAACLARGLAVEVIPGPCSVIQALVMSGFETSRFQFLGFLPKGAKGMLRQAMSYPGTSIAFESPERLVESLALICEIDEERLIAVAREMTKTFAECQRGKAKEVWAHFQKRPPKGEIVLLISAGECPDDLSLEELVAMLQELHGLSLKEAIKEAAKLKKMAKREVYQAFHRD